MSNTLNPLGLTNEFLHVDMSSDIQQGLELNKSFLIRFSDVPADNIIHDITSIPTGTLEHDQLIEQWLGLRVSPTTGMGDWPLCCNDQYLMAAVPVSILQQGAIDLATEAAYNWIFEQIRQLGYPYLLRTWNYFEDITESQGALNNYQLFCSGRVRAYSLNQDTSTTYPAATVIGTSSPGLFVYFIASKNEGIGIENTQQVSAFNYPTTYSQDPPLFSRAILHRNVHQEILFISGTASITGHNTQFADDVNRQVEVCLSNIENLLSTAIAEHQFANIALTDCAQVKVFLKNAEDLNSISTHMRMHLGPTLPTYFLRGDMCRPDLLVEIEAVVINDLT